MSTGCGQTVKTTCPYCGVGCGLLATKQDDGSVDIKGDPDHPANFGRLCSKGAALGQTIDLEGRLLEPEVYGERADWDAALDLVAEKFSEAVRDHGPDSVAFYVSGQILTEDYYVANKLMKGFIGSANIDTNSRLCMASSVAGHRKAFGTDTVPGTYEDLELSDVIVLVGSNLAWCHPVLYQRIEAAKRERPEMRVVLVDPRRTMTANIADFFLPIKPDGDAALFNGLLAYLEAHGHVDQAYVRQHTTGFEMALEAARGLSLEELVSQTGLPAAQLDEFYRLIAKTERVVTVYSQGVNQSVCGTDKVSAILNCHLATGRIGKPGCGPFSVTGQPNAMGGREVGGLANMLACHMDIENENHREIVSEFWGAPKLATQQGLKAVDMFDAVHDGRIKALWIMSTNPVDSMPEADKVRAALAACPFVVVSDILEKTDTMPYAHVKLPASGWGEKDGTVTNSERRISRQRKFLVEPGKARPDWWQLAEVAKRMGFAEAFDFTSPAEIFEEYAQLSSSSNDGTRDFDITGLSGLDAKDYDQLEPVQWPVFETSADQDLSSSKRFFGTGNFYTPDRKARFVPVQSTNVDVSLEDYPFVLNTGRVRDHWHTMTRTARAIRLSSHMAEPFCEISHADALKLKVAPASLLQIQSPHASIIVRAMITDRVQAGSAFVPMHWTDQYASRARVDALVPGRVDPFSGQPASKNVAVSIKPFKAGLYGFLVSRTKPNFAELSSAYWATAKCEGGWRTELAFENRLQADRFWRGVLRGQEPGEHYVYGAPNIGHARFANVSGNKLQAAIYLATEPVALARQWLVEQLTQTFETAAECQRVLAGRAGAGMADKGPLVCSCFGVGMNEILTAINQGHVSVAAVGKATCAGTNCGACQAEIKGLIDGTVQETRIAAE